MRDGRGARHCSSGAAARALETIRTSLRADQQLSLHPPQTRHSPEHRKPTASHKGNVRGVRINEKVTLFGKMQALAIENNVRRITFSYFNC